MLDRASALATDGGPVILVLAVLSVVSIAVIALKLIELSGTLGSAGTRDAAIEAWREGRCREAEGMLAEGAAPPTRLLATAMAALARRPHGPAFDRELERVGNEVLERLRRHLRILEVIATASPLLGLLGTVLGMIEAFQQLEMAGGAANAAVLAGGIWQALLTTAAGLVVAIPAAVAASLMSARVDRVGHAMESAVDALIAADEERRG
ncbi:MAG: MotA/TolQ/ExbB proton channel family protein [Pseudomonadota bacterium]